MQGKGGVYAMSFNFRIGRIHLDFDLGWLYIRAKLSVARKKRH